MRLIDADAVDAIIDAETERTTTFVEHETQANIKFAIKNLPTVEPVRGEWIPVKERLPEEEYDTVLAVTNAKHYAVYVYTSEHGFRTMDIDAIGEVIAWMPLPAPYNFLY